jgi:hypothetical protein
MRQVYGDSMVIKLVLLTPQLERFAELGSSLEAGEWLGLSQRNRITYPLQPLPPPVRLVPLLLLHMALVTLVLLFSILLLLLPDALQVRLGLANQHTDSIFIKPTDVFRQGDVAVCCLHQR